MILIIKNISMLYGKDLLFIDKGFICINENGMENQREDKKVLQRPYINFS